MPALTFKGEQGLTIRGASLCALRSNGKKRLCGHGFKNVKNWSYPKLFSCLWGEGWWCVLFRLDFRDGAIEPGPLVKDTGCLLNLLLNVEKLRRPSSRGFGGGFLDADTRSSCKGGAANLLQRRRDKMNREMGLRLK